MSPLSSIVVCKPQVPFSQRLTDPRLRRLTVAQLRRKARDHGLDVSRLIEKWEFVHVLVRQRTQGAQAHLEHVVDTKRRTIFDLPGEIRNKIYSYVLMDEASIVARYSKTRGGLSTYRPTMHLLDARGIKLDAGIVNPTSLQLLNMPWANRELRKEARGFFFANNTFEVKGNSRSSHVAFLKDIGPDGRASIAKLELAGIHFSTYTLDFLVHFSACTSLRELSMCMHVGHMLKRDTYDEMRDYVKFNSDAWIANGSRVELKSSRIKVVGQLPHPTSDCTGFERQLRHPSMGLHDQLRA
jgi:hypothetical protein